MIEPIPFCCISWRALAMRPSRSACEMGGGSGTGFSASAAAAITRLIGRVIAAARTPVPVMKLRR